MADLEPLLDDPASQAVALERYWEWLDEDISFCGRTDGEERYWSCTGFLDGAIEIYHYAPSERSWRFVRDAYDFVYAGLETARMRRLLSEDATRHFRLAADEYAWGRRPDSAAE
jgi:hypothetical protein